MQGHHLRVRMGRRSWGLKREEDVQKSGLEGERANSIG